MGGLTSSTINDGENARQYEASRNWAVRPGPLRSRATRAISTTPIATHWPRPLSRAGRRVRDAMDIIEGGPHLPLTISTLARQCHVSVRTLQEGFQRHLGMSPMAHVRVVRLRRAHRDLRSADPFHSTVSAIAHCWGFTHLGRFAAAHKTMYGQTPLQALRAAH